MHLCDPELIFCTFNGKKVRLFRNIEEIDPNQIVEVHIKQNEIKINIHFSAKNLHINKLWDTEEDKMNSL